MARPSARREKGISWIRTVLPTNRQPNIQTDRIHKTVDHQVQRNVVVGLAEAKIARRPLTAYRARLRSPKAPELVQLVK
jgi:hypothetical protein